MRTCWNSSSTSILVRVFVGKQKCRRTTRKTEMGRETTVLFSFFYLRKTVVVGDWYFFFQKLERRDFGILSYYYGLIIMHSAEFST